MTPDLRATGLLLIALGCLASPATAQEDTLAVRFGGLHGQVEVGGPYAGAEFHESRPFPARISFYYPVANSIDLSTDYWKRGDSRPFTAVLSVDGQADALHEIPMAYAWTPYRVAFERETETYATRISYQFGETLPIVAVRMRFTNTGSETARFTLDTALRVSLRTSHTYASRHAAHTRYESEGRTFVATFDAPDTDSAQVFVVNAGHAPSSDVVQSDSSAVFRYDVWLAPGEHFEVVHLIGSGRQDEVDLPARAADGWEADVAAYEHGIRSYAAHRPITVPDSSLMQTAHLARTLLRANRHHIDGVLAPMPAPAEYNFFFTHDLLLTDLGAVRFDVARVCDDLRYLTSLVAPDSTLAHAYYWKDGAYVTERANPDNWNHLWVNVVSASYLKHSGDTATVAALYPSLLKSLRLMLRNEHGGLMYANRPDWWDIGDVYGARAYLTALTIHGLESFAYTAHRLGRDADLAHQYLESAHTMRRELVEKLWDDEAGYLLNELVDGQIDRHYYSGSLLAASLGLLDPAKTETLLETARRELLDEAVGIRNAMPADFHKLIDTYKFSGMEAGAPFLYMNGGIWTQGSAWYILALLAADQPDAAREALTRYFTMDGLLQSPNGHPAFYEYRNGDPNSPRHGEIDKPTFLWAGGWYLNALYALAGARSDAWNLYFDPNLPEGFDDVSYHLMIEGHAAHVTIQGTGNTFGSLRVDGQPSHSAVVTGPASDIVLTRGAPTMPYLAAATARVLGVSCEPEHRTLVVEVAGVPGQAFVLSAVSPTAFRSGSSPGGARRTAPDTISTANGVTRVTSSFEFESDRAVVRLSFE